MGAEGSIELFEENQLEEELGMLKDESLKEIFDRSLSNMIDVLVHPLRMEYDFDWLRAQYNGCEDYKVNEFKYTCTDGAKLHCVKWIRDPDAKLCIVYLHTNSRCLSDATELLPLCNLLNANLLAFDQRGAGRSDGQLSFRLVEDLTSILESLCGGNQGVNVILWARGMSSYVAVQYVTQQQELLTKWTRTAPARRMIRRERQLQRQRELERAMKHGTDIEHSLDLDIEEEDKEPPQYVKFVVLDSPFTSLKDVVMEAAKNIDMLGASIPPMFVKFALYMFKDKIDERLDEDPYSIMPLSWVQSGKKHATPLPPCYILSADSDEHIPASMGDELAQEWRHKYDQGKSMCWYREFPGGHFNEREECLVMTPIQAILDYVSIQEVHTAGESGTTMEWSINGTIQKDNTEDNLNGVNGETCGSNDNIDSSGVQQSLDDEGPRWQDSSSVQYCNFCSAAFSMLFRKHHCRRCGLVVCSSCSTSRVPLPSCSRVSRQKTGRGGDESPGDIVKNTEDGSKGDSVAVVRVCDACVNLLHLTFK
mmetsp:Transcript_20448/g.37984  ORF Transcript_20448/g.37984 Transcript_20448/m.37984 type:complete len:536 (-) Transcript_20448:14-1621(-)